jgi:PAS domain S-box-containing protein
MSPLEDRTTADRLSKFPGVGTYAWHVAEDRVVWSPELVQMYGLEHAPSAERGFSDLLHPEDRTQVEAETSAFMGSGETYQHEFRIIRPDGAVRVIHDRGVIERDAEGIVTVLRGVNVDVTEQRTAATRPVPDTERLLAALQAGRLGIHDFDPRTGAIRWDTTVREIWGASPDEPITYATFAAGIHPDDLAATQAAVDAALDPDGPRRYEAVYRVTNRRTGAVRWVRADGDVSFAGRTAVWLVGTVQDITAQNEAEAALAESEARLRRAAEAAVFGIHDFDPRRQEAKWSPEMNRILGTTAIAPVAMADVQATLHTDDRERIRAEMIAIQRRIGPYELEFRITRPDGTTRWIMDRGEAIGPIDPGSGLVARVTGTLIDITARKASEAALAESERRFRQVVESLPLLIWTCRPDGSCDYLSPQWLQYTGRPEPEQLGSGWLDQVHPTDREAAITAWQEAYRTGRNLLVEFRIRRSDGAYRWFRTSAVPMRGTDGAIVRWFGTNVDIHEIREAEQALSESEERFRGVFEYARTGITLKGLDGSYRLCNPAYSSMLGFGTDDLLDQPFVDRVHPDDRDAYLAEIRRLLAGEAESLEVLNRYRRKDGEVIWVHKHVSLLRDGAGTPTNLLALVTDVTEQRKQEEHMRLVLRELDHRCKNLLALVQSVARLSAARTPETFLPDFEHRLRAIAAAHDLLVGHDWRDVLLADLVRSQIEHLGKVGDERIALAGPTVAITAQAAQILAMALHELATNATKYGALSGDAGRVTITWELAPDSMPDDSRLCLSWVESDGRPVAPPLRRGFGATVVETMIRSAFHCEVEYRFDPNGVVWRIDCPATSLVAGPG